MNQYTANYMMVKKALLMICGILVAYYIFPSESSALDQTCVVISVNNNAWITQKDATVKANLAVGDALSEGDHVEVYAGNSIGLAFDKTGENVVHIEGRASFTISKLYPTRIDLAEGKAYAFLDNRRSLRSFKISTPSAITTVWGTRYKIDVSMGKCEVLNYKGRVRVSGRDLEGNETIDFVLLYDREKTGIQSVGAPPRSAEPLTDVEAYLAGMIDSKIQLARENIKGGSGVLRRFARASGSLIKKEQEKRSKSVLVPAVEKKETSEGEQFLF